MADKAKDDDKAVATQRVKLLSYLSGKDGSLPPGSVVDLELSEATRLIELGAAVEVKEAAADEEKKG
ncbi:hypothetical protein [Rhizobium sp. IMFF44]|uniref:hypothetical protein n=1 Tax=Rhizobium sp. IMFF44 TaxID=3342350 RepID=UPI0035B9744F